MIIIIICTTCYSSNSSRQIALYFTRDVCSLMVYIFPLLISSYLFSSLSIFSLLISSRYSLACLRLHYFLTSVPTLFYSILSHSAFFDFVPFYSILAYSILSYFLVVSFLVFFSFILFYPIIFSTFLFSTILSSPIIFSTFLFSTVQSYEFYSHLIALCLFISHRNSSSFLSFISE